jgi:hypothetical protein
MVAPPRSFLFPIWKLSETLARFVVIPTAFKLRFLSAQTVDIELHKYSSLFWRWLRRDEDPEASPVLPFAVPLWGAAIIRGCTPEVRRTPPKDYKTHMLQNGLTIVEIHSRFEPSTPVCWPSKAAAASGLTGVKRYPATDFLVTSLTISS